MRYNEYLSPALRAVLLLVLTLVLGGCSWFSPTDKEGRYGQDTQGRKLELPPDLTSPEYDDAYTLSSGKSAADGGGVVAVLPDLSDLNVQRDGRGRWLEVQATPEVLWGKLQGFWVDQEMPLQLQDASLGIMQTDWMSETGAPSKGFFGSLAGSLFGGQSKDRLVRYRIRLERSGEGLTRVYLTQRMLEKYLVNDEDLHWKTIPFDPELEAQMLTRLLVYLGHQEAEAKTLIADADTAAAAVSMQLTQIEGRHVLVIEDRFNRTWRRVGVALDHIGMMIDDQNRAQGIYFVTYRGDKKEKRGFLQSVFGIGEGDVLVDKQYQVHVVEQGEQNVEVSAHDAKGETLKSAAAEKILSELRDNLK